MRHVLVATVGHHTLVDKLRAATPPSTTFLAEHGLEATLERLARSSRIDAVVTDDPEVLMEIYHEIPGALPVYLARPDEEASAILAALDAALTA